MNINDFSGAKIAILARDHVLALLRDNKPGIPFPNMWDLPGGGRDGAEAPLDCALRELWEEAAIRISPEDVTWRRLYRNPQPGGLAHWFFVARPGWLTLPPPRLGDEGQAARWMPVEKFLSLENVVPHLVVRLADHHGDICAEA
ncbi:MutT/nudix family protein [Candidatus Rhodobacter oscarellae]|uniref:MutT/nudix family protein n=1 Tax=Candidatus Rhodobacter oscarellae TaxID=1675527 RepID=A0A0J9E8M2_9RHOB|nr:NUDIX hydrolase [Candidatus Rhodobacter lobularis]KMW59112.1 MutT/nudix family protein [Candidatus Rhodobacter lobularis]